MGLIRSAASAAVVLAVLAGADAGARGYAEHQLASRAQRAAQLAAAPSVHIAGVPFLTQAIGGRYREIDVTAHDLRPGGVTLRAVSVRALGVHVPLTDAVRGQVGAVPIDRAVGSVTVADVDLDALTGGLVHFRGGPHDVLTATGSLRVAGQSVSVSASAQVSVAGGVLAVLPLPGAISAVTGVLPAAFAAAARSLLTVRVPLGPLPFGVHLTAVQIGAGVITLTGTATGLVVHSTGR